MTVTPLGNLMNRREAMIILAAGAASVFSSPVFASNADIGFNDLYSKYGVLGLEFSDRVKALNGKPVRMGGFMAPPLKAEADFFVLTEIPMAICPFCSSDSDWPDNIVVIYLNSKQTFVQPNKRIEVEGMLEMGSWTDPETGFLSRLRIRNADYRVA